jgi:hypothetical protein
MAESSADHLDERGAHELASRIKTYWEERGCAVQVRVEQSAGGPHNAPIWVVRSDLGQYLPNSH